MILSLGWKLPTSSAVIGLGPILPLGLASACSSHIIGPFFLVVYPPGGLLHTVYLKGSSPKGLVLARTPGTLGITESKLLQKEFQTGAGSSLLVLDPTNMRQRWNRN